MSDKPVSILVDPALNIDDVRLALRHSSLEVESTAFPQLFIIKPTPSSPTDDTVRVPALCQAG
jgi:hypothetical protein